MSNTGAVLAAAGLSSRMGEFKPLLPFGNSTIAGHIVSELQALGIAPIVVVTGYRGGELEAHLDQYGVRFVRNERFRETQMFDSIKLGIQSILGDCGRILIMPIDMPSISLRTFKSVVDAQGLVIRASCGGKPAHPLILDRAVAEMILDYTGDGGLKGAVYACGLDITDVPVDDIGTLKDADTPEQYQELLEIQKTRT